MAGGLSGTRARMGSPSWLSWMTRDGPAMAAALVMLGLGSLVTVAALDEVNREQRVTLGQVAVERDIAVRESVSLARQVKSACSAGGPVSVHLALQGACQNADRVVRGVGPQSRTGPG